LFKVLHIVRREKKSGRKREYNRQFRTPILNTSELEFNAIRKIALDSLSVGVFLLIFPFGDLNQHLLEDREVLQKLQGNSVASEAFTVEYRLEEIFSLHSDSPSSLEGKQGCTVLLGR